MGFNSGFKGLNNDVLPEEFPDSNIVKLNKAAMHYE